MNLRPLLCLLAFCAGTAFASEASSVAAEPTSNTAPAPKTFEQAKSSESVCLVRTAYALQPTDPLQGVEEAVSQCVNFDQGLGRWYREARVQRGDTFSATAAPAVQTLAALRDMAKSYLQLDMRACSTERLALEACLKRMKLPQE